VETVEDVLKELGWPIRLAALAQQATTLPASGESSR
jgi:hypothetical protein